MNLYLALGLIVVALVVGYFVGGAQAKAKYAPTTPGTGTPPAERR